MRALRLLVWPLLIAAIVAALLLWPKPPLTVQTARVLRGEVKDVVTSAVAGEVKPDREAQVRSELSGTVARLLARRGDRVAEGQVVVRLDPRELDARVDEAKAQLEVARAALAQAQAQEAQAKPTADRLGRLERQGAATPDQAERARALSAEAAAAIQSARAQIDQAQAALELAKLSRQKADIAAPFAGALQQLYPEVGAELTPGAPAFDLTGTEATHVETSIDEADAARVALGQPAELTLDAYPGVRFLGKVSLVAPAVAPDPRLGSTRSLPIWVAVEPDPRLRIGMSSTVEIIVARKVDVLFVPSQVVVGRGAERSVYRLSNGVVKKAQVTVGISNWERTEIRSGLGEGDLVVTSLDAAGLADGVRAVAGTPDAG
ncbi:MAG: efflux RND transporter periplasmic adaptor subunit [Deltaproteobacteria bacterium]